MENKFYGDTTRWFIGRVVNNADPKVAGRVQVRIYGIHSENLNDISDEDLPWAECLVPTTEGGVSGIGRMPQLKETAMVFGIFLDGEKSQSPLILGSMVHPEVPSLASTLAAASRGDFSSTNLSTLGPNGIKTSSAAKRAYGKTPNLRQARVAAMTFFVDAGVPVLGAAGIVGNLQQESTFNPTVENSIGAYGLAQWTPDSGRRQLMERWMNQNGKDKEDFFNQLQYILHEVGVPNGVSTATNENGLRFNVGKRLMSANRYKGGPYGGRSDAQSNGNSTWVWLTQYEIPGNHLEEIIRRERYASEAYDDYQATISSAGVST